ncbi:MAG: DUF938 domain-containing protein [Polyangiales bacterium]
MPDARRHSAAAERNQQPLLAAFKARLAEQARVLEIASGTGQHAAFFSAAMPGWQWQPTDADPEHFDSIRAWRQAHAAGSVAEPLSLDVQAQPWPVCSADAVVAINLLHISPWPCTAALFAGARSVLKPGRPLFVYGPFREGGQHISASNADFEQWLLRLDARYGVRDIAEVSAAAEAQGFALAERAVMPANNRLLVFRRQPDLT